MTPTPIRFFHRGHIVEAPAAHPTRSVLDWLREDAHCTGTKEGCNEGDCGACTVVVGELSADGQSLNLHPANACIRFVPTLHGKALFTVEDLQPASPSTASPSTPATLHPVQQAVVDCHGSQCGFCTPGFVMSLWHVYQQHRALGTRPSREELADALSGNLCRCTGYRPLLEAGQRMFEPPAVAFDAAPVIAALKQLQTDDGMTCTGTTHQVAGPRTDHFHAPRTLDALARLREAHPQARLLAGATDMGLWVNKQFRDVGDLIYLGNVHELKQIELHTDVLSIGAGASLEAAWRALAAQAPSLTEVWKRFASPPIRHAGTLGGNVANGSPIGDAPPVLMALDAQVELRQGTRVRTLPLHGFYLGYMKNQMQDGEFIQALHVPRSALARTVRAYKISKRFDADISSLCAAFALELDGDTVTHIRLAYGGMAATVKRATHAEDALHGQAWTAASVQAAQAALASDFQPLSDMRASAAYRLQVAQNLLQRFWLETRPLNPLPASATRVWPLRVVAE